MRVLVDGYCWLDKRSLTEDNVFAIRNALTITPRKTSELSKQDPSPIEMFCDDDDRMMLGVPRQWYLDNRTSDHEEIVRVSDGARMGDFPSLMRHDGPYAEQAVAIDTMYDAMNRGRYGGGILKAGCAFGKTCVGLSFARKMGRRTLIVAHKQFLLNQWVRRIEEFMPGARVGIIRQAKCQFEDKDFVVAMMSSLASSGRKYPKEMYDAFGLVIFDECHRISAYTWAPIAPRFNARWKLGLTATDRRKDGAEDVFRHHIGKIVYRAKSQSVVPDIRRIHTNSLLRPVNRYGKFIPASKLTRVEEIAQLTTDADRTRYIAEDVAQAVALGRKVMVLSERIEHIREMSRCLTGILMGMVDKLDFVPVIDFYVGEWSSENTGPTKRKTRTEAELKKAESANVIFATVQMVQEGLDIEALDVIVLASPMTDVEQAVGRVRRSCLPREGKCERLCPWRAWKCNGKPVPIVTDVVDSNIKSSMSKSRSRNRFYKSIGAT